jgi:hypothetical protein
MTFAGPSKYFGESERRRLTHAPETLPTLFDTAHIMSQVGPRMCLCRCLCWCLCLCLCRCRCLCRCLCYVCVVCKYCVCVCACACVCVFVCRISLSLKHSNLGVLPPRSSYHANSRARIYPFTFHSTKSTTGIHTTTSCCCCTAALPLYSSFSTLASGLDLCFVSLI